MSCILYSKASYNLLAKNPLFRHICQIDLHVEPERIAENWYSLNVKAYNRRYQEEVDPAGECTAEADYEFKDRLTGKYTDLYKLMGRIYYQLLDGDFEKTEDAGTYNAFLDFREHVAHKAIEILAPLERVQIPNNAISLFDMITTGKGTR